MAWFTQKQLKTGLDNLQELFLFEKSHFEKNIISGNLYLNESTINFVVDLCS